MRRLLFAVTALITFAVPSLAAIQAAPESQVASLGRHHDDGSEYVWRVFCNSGLSYSFIPASQFPVSARFEEVNSPQTGDIAWWPEFVAIFVAQNQSLITQAGMIKLADLSADGARPHFFRMRVMAGEDPGNKPTTGMCERNLL
jgi:hypothetical protein